MSVDPVRLLVVLDFAAIGLLPVLFFRRDGRYNLRWLVTALPFFVVPVAIVAASLGRIEPLAIGTALARTLTDGAAVTLAALSIGLLAMTVGSHRIPISLWHQHNDAPVEIVTWGPYARIRHPFYSSFLLAFLAAAVALPHALTLASLAWGAAALSLTARREERRLRDSQLGEAYCRYMEATGRFFPGLG